MCDCVDWHAAAGLLLLAGSTALTRDTVVSNVDALYVPGNFNALATFAS